MTHIEIKVLKRISELLGGITVDNFKEVKDLMESKGLDIRDQNTIIGSLQHMLSRNETEIREAKEWVDALRKEQ